MLGLGTFGNGNGGSSTSSSNLSALAQPFMVDRPVSKPPSNPLVNFAESTYVAPFNSSLHNWVHPQSSSSRTDYFSNPDSVVDSVQPPSNSYRYSVSQPVNSPVINMPPLSHVVSGVAHLPSLSPISSAGTDVFLFGQCSDRSKTSLVEANPYYQTPYVTPSIEDNSPLVVFNEPSYDLLSTSHAGHMNGSTSLDDYTQSMSGLEYPTPWSGFWSGLADDEHGKHVELNGSLCTKESNFVGSSIYSSYANQGDLTAEGVRNHEEVSVPSHRKYADILGRDNSVGSLSPDHFNNKSFYEQQANPMTAPLDFPRISFSGSTSPLSETHHPQASSLESATNSWNCRKPLTASYEKCFVKVDSCVDDPASKAKSSPAIIIRPPANSASSLGVNTVSLRNMTCTDNSDFSGHHPSKMEELYIPVTSECKELYSDTSKLNGLWQRNDRLSVESSSTRKDELSNNEMGMKDADNLLKARPELQVPNLNVEDGYTFSPKSTEAVLSMDNTSETFDYYNPAVDSPCWKGATTSHFSPFEVSEALSPCNLTGQFKPLYGFNLQGPHSFSLNIDDAIIVSSQKPNENPEYHENMCGEHDLLPSQKRPSVGNHPSKEQKSCNAFEAGPFCPKLSSGDRNQFSADINQQKINHLLMNSSRSDSNLEPSHAMQQSFDEMKFTSERKLLPGVGVEVTGNSISDVLGHDSFHETYHLTEKVSCSSLSGDDASTKLDKGVSESAPKIDVHMLINTVQDLSVLLLSHCSEDAFSLKEQDHETLTRVIGNLEACLTKKVQQLTEQDSSHFLDELPDLNKSTSASCSFGKKMAETNVEDQFHCRSDQKDKRQYSVSGNKDEKLSAFVSLGTDEDTVNDDNTTQAIRKILDKNFHHEEETDPQALLYRNLWLEAEAALCSITYRARFDHMKIEMDKLNLRKTEENTKNIEKPSSSQVLSDLNTVDKFERESEENPEPDIMIMESSNVNAMNHVADVVDRFHILKNRYEQSDSLNTKDVGKQSISKFSCDINSDDNLDPEVKVDHSPKINTSSVSDDVMARFIILKCRDDKSNSMTAERQHLSEEEDLEFAGKGNNWMFIKDRLEDATLGHDMQVHSSKGKFDSYLDDYNCNIVKALHERVTDDTVIQLPRFNWLQNQLPAGFSDGSSSDWEHVLKEDLPGGN